MINCVVFVSCMLLTVNVAIVLSYRGRRLHHIPYKPWRGKGGKGEREGRAEEGERGKGKGDLLHGFKGNRRPCHHIFASGGEIKQITRKKALNGCKLPPGRHFYFPTSIFRASETTKCTSVGLPDLLKISSQTTVERKICSTAVFDPEL